MRFLIKHLRYVVILAFLVLLYFFLPVADRCISEQGSNKTTCGQFSEAELLLIWWRSTALDPNWVVAFSTFFVAIFTVALWRSTAVLSAEARVQRRLTTRALKLASANAVATKAAADAAQEASKIAEQSMVSAHRPWVVITNVMQKGRLNSGADDVDQGYELAVSVKTIGNSPATRVFANAMTVGNTFPSDAELLDTIDKLRRKTPSPGITLIPGNDDFIDAYCLAYRTDGRQIDARLKDDLGLIVCCVFYSFPFKAERNEGCFTSVYRVFKVDLKGRELKIALEKRYEHAE